MIILSEAGVRKIVRKKLMNEIGFSNIRSKQGDYSVTRCDLKNLDQTELAVKFAKHFVFNPVITKTTVDSKSLDPKTSVSSKKNIISFINGHGLTPEEEKKYDQIVRDMIRDDPSLVGKYVDMLETAMTYSFGMFSDIVCSILTSGLDDQSINKSLRSQKDKESAENLTQDQSLIIQNALNQSAEQFWIENLIKNSLPVVRGLYLDKKYSILFPKTILSLKVGDNTKAATEFQIEKLKAERLINTSNIYPSKIFEVLSNDIFNNVHQKRIILRPIEKLIKNSKDSYQSGNLFRTELIKILKNAEDYFTIVI